MKIYELLVYLMTFTGKNAIWK